MLYRHLPRKAQLAPLIRSKGLTLVEVMVALFVLGIVLAGAVTVMTKGFFAVDYSRNLTRVSQILQTEMETLRTFSWAEIEALPASGEFTPFSGVASFTIKNLECKRIVSTVKTDQKKIRLVVKWTDSRAVQHQRAYEAYYTKEGLSDYYSRAL